MVIIVATVMVVMVVVLVMVAVLNMVVIVFRTGQDKLTFKLHFPGNLFRAAFAILAMFLSIVFMSLSIVPCSVHCVYPHPTIGPLCL